MPIPMMEWWHWAIFGLVLIGLEMLTLGGLGNFYFLFFGISGLLVGGATWLGLSEAPWLQWVLFAVFGVLALFVLRKPIQNKMNSGATQQGAVDSMVGKVATVLEHLPPQGAGKAELRGSTWTARNASGTPLTKGQRCQVVRVEGLTLWIQAESPIQEEHHVG